MAKQAILGALEDVIGEYVVNLDKENLKFQALRGRIRMENVQLDGDFIGGRILGSIGLSGFGVLSCCAKTVKITVPLNNIEKEPTKIEIKGIHLLCLPLLPSTANKMYGTGTAKDPTCTLRTRVKRSKLARYEKNFKTGRIAGEGPVARRIMIAARNVEKEERRKKKKRQSTEGSESDAFFNYLVSDLQRQNQSTKSATTDASEEKSLNNDAADLYDLPRDWKVRLREKILRNLELVMIDIHVRCEVSEGGLEFGVQKKERGYRGQRTSTDSRGLSYDQRAFAFGTTLDKLRVRTANEDWKIGSHEKKKQTSKQHDHLGAHPYDVRNNKIFGFENFCMYWDDDPPFLLSETDIIKSPDRRISADSFHLKIGNAMAVLVNHQLPGRKVYESLTSKKKSSQSKYTDHSRPHQYCFQNFNYEVKQRLSDRTQPGAISCEAEFLPFQWDWKLRPSQLVQYRKLKSAMLSQRRFDTMLRQKPSQSPRRNPLDWWKYAYGCITNRPNSRPWEDILRIVRNRGEYLELVLRKLSKAKGGSGYHAGLTESESSRLLELEELLPIEALMAFHLIALRKHFDSDKDSDGNGEKLSDQGRTKITKKLSRMFRSKSKSSLRSQESSLGMSGEVNNSQNPETSLIPAATSDSISILQAMKLRLGRKQWKTRLRFLQTGLTISLLTESNDGIVKLVTKGCGEIKLLGPGHQDVYFDIARFELFDCQENNGNNDRLLFVQAATGDLKILDESLDSRSEISEAAIIAAPSATSFMELPPNGVVCRFAAIRRKPSKKISLSAHPATLIWTTRCFDALAEFFGAPTSKMKTELTQHLKNVSTPLARKAQLAFLSQSDFQFFFNIAAPKIWVPFSVNMSYGSLLFDAGNFRLVCAKEDGQMGTNWDLDASDIQINYARCHLSEVRQRILNSLLEPASREMVPIIRPFQVSAVSGMKDAREVADSFLIEHNAYTGAVVNLDISVSPICLNLVDAEVLARAIGKWYSQGIVAVRGRAFSRNEMPAQNNSRSYSPKQKDNHVSESRLSTPHCLSLTIDKIEMALEGHSKIHISDERSLESYDTIMLGDATSHTRTYVVELFEISARRSRHNQVTATELLINDASVVQVKNPSEYKPLADRHIAVEDQYCILERRQIEDSSNHTSVPVIHDGIAPKVLLPGQILKASLFRDGRTHLDEVEIDIESVVLRVTPTSLKDCAKGIRKIVELVQLMTKEMERNVHEQGRKARQQGSNDQDDIEAEQSKQGSPAFSVTSDLTNPHSDLTGSHNEDDDSFTKSPSDSSLLFKVTIRDGMILAGRPTSSGVSDSRASGSLRRSYAFAVVHVSSNALIMFQSIENFDASGNTTLHASLDNLSISVTTAFDSTTASISSPMIGPTGAELRIMNATENQGCVVSRELSIDCEHLKSALTPNDLRILVNILKTMMNRLKGESDGLDSARETMRRSEDSGVAALMKYQKRGTGIATSIRVEFQTFSFVVLRAYRSKFGAPEFLSFNLKEMKAKLDGCMSALTGECNADISVDYFNSEVGVWDHAVEPFPITLHVDQMPNELIMDATTPKPVQLNLTGILLHDVAELSVDSLKTQESTETPNVLTPSVLSTVGLRRATESHTVSIHNFTGVDIEVHPMASSLASTSRQSSVRIDTVGLGLVKDSSCVSIESIVDVAHFQNSVDEAMERMKLSLQIAPTGVGSVGEREMLSGLPISSSLDHAMSMHFLKPKDVGKGGTWEQRNCFEGRSSPETVHTEMANSAREYAIYHAEPVVEWCMQNQRLRSSTVDLYSLKKGRDLLSATIWSPQEDYNEDTIAQVQSKDTATMGKNDVGSPSRKGKNHTSDNSEWLRPYLKNDSPEWTDMTCILRMARERVMLPDSNWIWVNNWSVDVNGVYGESTDADGWEYQADFETFTRTRRFYQRGDSCRRRRWTRTRIVKPPKLDDPRRPLRLVWETSRDDRGNYRVEVKSHVTVHNLTGLKLAIFVSSPTWDEEKFAGTMEPARNAHIPIALSSALYLRLAKSRSGRMSNSLDDYATSDKVMILPTGYNSNVLVRTCLEIGDVSETNLHFLFHIECKRGIVDIHVQPVLRVVNLLPCQLECQLGELLRPSERRQADSRPSLPLGMKKRVAAVESLTVASGKEGKCSAVNPSAKPHISLRVPGYKWSCWQRIVNRKASSCTWRPEEREEDLYLNFEQNDIEQGDEFRMTVRFDRLGDAYRDPLVLIVAVECGHCPIVRVYAQYWIVDKTGFGCHFCESTTNLMGTSPDVECSRRSHLLKEDSRIPAIKRDMKIEGHQWSIGMSGMSLYFSRQERIALSIESGADDSSYLNIAKKSQWTVPVDVSNVMPKAVLSVDENGGSRRFELAIAVTMCDAVFSRTKLIAVIPRYQIVNLLKRDIVLAQDGCLKAPIVIPTQASVSYHWERQSLPPKVRLGAPNAEEKASKKFSSCWAIGCIQLDRIGITSMRLPMSTLLPTKPMVVQAEVRLATKEQSSAVVIVLWSTNEKSNPLYVLRNTTPYTIICRQPLQAEENQKTVSEGAIVASVDNPGGPSIECGAEFSPIVRSMLGLERLEEFVWILKDGEVACFGFDDPEKPHILEWACADDENPFFRRTLRKAVVEVDAMGSTSSLGVGDNRVIRCQIGAELSTKVIEFSVEEPPENRRNLSLDPNSEVNDDGHLDFKVDDEDHPSFTFRFNLPVMCASFIDNLDPSRYGREILMASFENLFLAFSQSREGYHEMELQLMSLQVDNHVPSSIHPVLLFCPKNDDKEPFLHMSAVRRMQQSFTYVFRYAACRMLEVHIFLDRRTAETVARYIEPITKAENMVAGKTANWVSHLTNGMATKFSHPDRRAPREVELLTRTANSGRIYFEQLHLHPVRISLTFTQEWMESSQTESMMVFQFIRGMASIADAPLTFTSFVVAHVFESPQTLVRVIATHYSSQLTKQIFTILGSLAILGVPADFISNVGTGVRDFFYEPIQGAVHGPRQFIEGLEAGTQSLARGVFVGVVRGAANVTEVINSNLAGLTADDDFIDERKAHQRMLTDAMSRGVTSRTFYNSLFLAGASIARGVKSGAYGIVDQPTRYASKFGPVGFMKGVGKAMVGALVKPVVGVGDAATLLMNHVSDATSNKQVHHKIPKRLRRALPSTNSQKPNCVSLEPYDDRAAKAQKIVTGGESVDDVYIGHVNIPSHLIIASEQCLWAIDRGSREPWCVAWEEISHFGVAEMGMRIAVFSQTGLKTFLFHTEDDEETEELHRLLAMQLQKTGNSSSNLSELRPSSGDDELDIMLTKIPGIKSQQSRHVFGSCNAVKKRLPSSVKDEIDLIEQCFERIKRLGGSSNRFFASIDEEAWNLVSCWGQVFSGLSSRRCIAASVINGTGGDIQIKSTKLVEGGSPCYSLPTKEFDPDQGVLHAGGVILFFGWGVVPSLLQPGNVFMHIETNGFIADLADQKSRDTLAEATSGYRIGFLEKSYDDAGWWAKYWLILLRDDDGN